MNFEFGKYIAHRGLHDDDIAENSLSAFKKAIEKNLPAELDVRMTKDGKAVVFHDETLMRLCGFDMFIDQLTYEQLQAFDLKDNGEKIPLLVDVLKTVNGKIPLMIDIKQTHTSCCFEKRLAHILKQYKGDFAVASYDPVSLAYFRIKMPEVKRIQKISKFTVSNQIENFKHKVNASPFTWKLVSKPDIVAVDLRAINLETAFQVIDNNSDIFVFTANNEELMELSKMFAKTIIAENFPEDFDFSEKLKGV